MKPTRDDIDVDTAWPVLGSSEWERDSRWATWNEPNLLIDGELVSAEGGATLRRRSTRRPRRSSARPPMRRVADASGRSPRPGGRSTRRPGRPTSSSAPTCLRQLATAMRDNLEDLRALTVAEVGCPGGDDDGRRRSRARSSCSTTTPTSPSSTSRSPTSASSEAYGSQHRLWIEREPYGVVSAISAYNYPTQLNLAKLGPALAAGCTVVLKGAPDTPLITLALGQADRRADRHPGRRRQRARVERGRDRASSMTTDPNVDMITFTGSTPVGKAIMARRQRHAEEDVPRARRQVGVPRARRRVARLRHDDVRDGHGSHAGQGCAITSRLAVPRAQVRRRRRDGAGVYRRVSTSAIRPTRPTTSDR